MGLTTARGHGPPPPGFYTCRDPRCAARRDPFTGRFTSATHYHPIKGG